uniref:Uncharacterized protein n=1 Tax=Zea mays TaxID=4577 RepID=C0PFQ3_MAIZE|nr:unknown [Zea mays]
MTQMEIRVAAGGLKRSAATASTVSSWGKRRKQDLHCLSNMRCTVWFPPSIPAGYYTVTAGFTHLAIMTLTNSS